MQNASQQMLFATTTNARMNIHVYYCRLRRRYPLFADENTQARVCVSGVSRDLTTRPRARNVSNKSFIARLNETRANPVGSWTIRVDWKAASAGIVPLHREFREESRRAWTHTDALTRQKTAGDPDL